MATIGVSASERIGDTPPTVLRNCVGGFTWKGRTASASVTGRGDDASFVSRYSPTSCLVPPTVTA